jgi:hypothetical protein
MHEITQQKQMDTNTKLLSLPPIVGTQQGMREILKQYRGLKVQESEFEQHNIPTFDEFSRNLSEEWSRNAQPESVESSHRPNPEPERAKMVKIKKKKANLLSKIRTNTQVSAVLGPLSAPVEHRVKIPTMLTGEFHQSSSPIELPPFHASREQFSSTLLITQQVDDRLSYLKRRLSSLPPKQATERVTEELENKVPCPVLEESKAIPPLRTPIPMSENTRTNWLALFHGQLLALKVCNSYRSIVERSMAAVREAPLKGNTNSLTHMLKEYIVEVDLEYNRQVIIANLRWKVYSEYLQLTD